jgi:hypothetical protein
MKSNKYLNEKHSLSLQLGQFQIGHIQFLLGRPHFELRAPDSLLAVVHLKAPLPDAALLLGMAVRVLPALGGRLLPLLLQPGLPAVDVLDPCLNLHI